MSRGTKNLWQDVRQPKTCSRRRSPSRSPKGGALDHSSSLTAHKSKQQTIQWILINLKPGRHQSLDLSIGQVLTRMKRRLNKRSHNCLSLQDRKLGACQLRPTSQPQLRSPVTPHPWAVMTRLSSRFVIRQTHQLIDKLRRASCKIRKNGRKPLLRPLQLLLKEREMRTPAQTTSTQHLRCLMPGQSSPPLASKIHPLNRHPTRKEPHHPQTPPPKQSTNASKPPTPPTMETKSTSTPCANKSPSTKAPSTE